MAVSCFGVSVQRNIKRAADSGHIGPLRFATPHLDAFGNMMCECVASQRDTLMKLR